MADRQEDMFFIVGLAFKDHLMRLRAIRDDYRLIRTSVQFVGGAAHSLGSDASGCSFDSRDSPPGRDPLLEQQSLADLFDLLDRELARLVIVETTLLEGMAVLEGMLTCLYGQPPAEPFSRRIPEPLCQATDLGAWERDCLRNLHPTWLARAFYEEFRCLPYWPHGPTDQYLHFTARDQKVRERDWHKAELVFASATLLNEEHLDGLLRGAVGVDRRPLHLNAPERLPACLASHFQSRDERLAIYERARLRWSAEREATIAEHVADWRDQQTSETRLRAASPLVWFLDMLGACHRTLTDVLRILGSIRRTAYHWLEGAPPGVPDLPRSYVQGRGFLFEAFRQLLLSNAAVLSGAVHALRDHEGSHLNDRPEPTLATMSFADRMRSEVRWHGRGLAIDCPLHIAAVPRYATDILHELAHALLPEHASFKWGELDGLAPWFAGAIRRAMRGFDDAVESGVGWRDAYEGVVELTADAMAIAAVGPGFAISVFIQSLSLTLYGDAAAFDVVLRSYSLLRGAADYYKSLETTEADHTTLARIVELAELLFLHYRDSLDTFATPRRDDPSGESRARNVRERMAFVDVGKEILPKYVHQMLSGLLAEEKCVPQDIVMLNLQMREFSRRLTSDESLQQHLLGDYRRLQPPKGQAAQMVAQAALHHTWSIWLARHLQLWLGFIERPTEGCSWLWAQEPEQPTFVHMFLRWRVLHEAGANTVGEVGDWNFGYFGAGQRRTFAAVDVGWPGGDARSDDWYVPMKVPNVEQRAAGERLDWLHVYGRIDYLKLLPSHRDRPGRPGLLSDALDPVKSAHARGQHYLRHIDVDMLCTEEVFPVREDAPDRLQMVKSTMFASAEDLFDGVTIAGEGLSKELNVPVLVFLQHVALGAQGGDADTDGASAVEPFRDQLKDLVEPIVGPCELTGGRPTVALRAVLRTYTWADIILWHDCVVHPADAYHHLEQAGSLQKPRRAWLRRPLVDTLSAFRWTLLVEAIWQKIGGPSLSGQHGQILDGIRALTDLFLETGPNIEAPNDADHALVYSFQAWRTYQYTPDPEIRSVRSCLKEINGVLRMTGCSLECKGAFGTLDYVGRLSVPASAWRPGPHLESALGHDPGDGRILPEIASQAFLVLLHMLVTQWLVSRLAAREIITQINVLDRLEAGDIAAQ